MEQTREAIEDRLTDLRRQRGAAVLDGKKFDPAAIVAAENDLEAFDEAEAEATRREREAIERQRGAAQSRLRKQLVDLEVSRLAALTEANDAAHKLAESIGRTIVVSESMARVAHELTGHGAPIVLQRNSFVSRLAGRLAAVMQSIPGQRHRLGHIEWVGASLYGAGDDWADAERALASKHLENLIGKDKTHGNGNGKG